MRKILYFLCCFLGLLFLMPPAVFALDVNQLTLDQAVNLALKNSIELQQAWLDVEINEVKRDEAWDTYHAVLLKTNIPGTEYFISLPPGQDPDGLVYKTEFDLNVSKINYNTKVDTVVAEVYQKYYSVLQSESNVRVKSLAFEQASRQMDVASAKYLAGLESPLGLEKLKVQLMSAQSELENAKEDLNRAYRELNELLGLPEESRLQLIDTVSYQPLDIQEPELLIDSIVEESPAVCIAEKARDLKKKTYGMVNSYEVDNIELDKARNEIDRARQSMREVVRTVYDQILSVERQYGTVLEGIKLAEKALNIARLQYELGMITDLDVIAAEAALADSQNALLSIACNHELLKYAFYKPWTAGILVGGTALSAGQGVGSTDE